MASSIGIANPRPSIPLSINFKLVIPITSPLTLHNGPPLLPLLIAASVCNTLIIQSAEVFDSTLTATPLSLPDKTPLVVILL